MSRRLHRVWGDQRHRRTLLQSSRRHAVRGKNSLWTKLSFCFGGLITLFQLFHTPCKVRKLPSHQRNSKKGSFVHSSLHNSLSLTLASQNLLAFVLYNISALSYLPRARTSAPRRSQDTLLYCFSLRCSRRSRFVSPTQQSGVTSHYSVGSQARCHLPGAADAIYIHYFLLLSLGSNCSQVAYGQMHTLFKNR